MNNFKMPLPGAVVLIIDTLKNSGFSAHVVGGAVRDSLIGRELGDFDITTDASPEETKSAFSGFKTIDTGIKHGTVTVVIDHTPYEITTYRIDGDYKDKRHPDSVTFTKDLADDLKRRDFTVNAMCYSPADGFIDLFGGVADAEAEIIRAVGDPYVRFDEDALRILRALRFASVLDFGIEKRTAEAAVELAESLKGVSGERIYAELKKLIMGKAASRILLEYSSVLRVVLGDISVCKYPRDSELSGTDIFTRLSALFLLNSDRPADDATRTLSNLKTDNLTRLRTENVLRGYEKASFDNKRAVLCTLAELGRETVEGILELGVLTGRFGINERTLYSEVIASNPVYTVSGLNIGGRELISLGYKGPKIGEALNRLLYAVIDGECENTAESLLEFLTK